MNISLKVKPRKCIAYSISKAGLNMLTVHQAEDLKEKLPGVVVSSDLTRRWLAPSVEAGLADRA